MGKHSHLILHIPNPNSPSSQRGLGTRVIQLMFSITLLLAIKNTRDMLLDTHILPMQAIMFILRMSGNCHSQNATPTSSPSLLSLSLDRAWYCWQDSSVH